MKVTYYGHSCFAVNVGGKDVLFDPFITPNDLAKHINVADVKADYIFVSHAHFDHMNDGINIALRTGAKVVANWEIYNWFGKNGITNAQPMNPGGKWEFDFGKVKCVPAHHSSSFPDGSYGGVASGFVFHTAEGSFYYTGDAALSLEMQLIKRLGKLDFLVAPIGDLLTMGPDDAIELAKWLEVKEVLGVHYDTFGFIQINHEEVKKQFADAGLNLRLLPIGATENF
ncbi:metal-dependent hydrolase [Chitinophaga horti]|uniref:Metal-dependent hydrolase n=1 Tax=Chitinophaga horti TaxID=2920382 RepID=A0ABY6J6F9_9BACT|nr:metal-dependent hydrolase [Chitinophaga horti]UYQ95256.1 metal-dependent hydrolase [Chitinophaga horti]